MDISNYTYLLHIFTLAHLKKRNITLVIDMFYRTGLFFSFLFVCLFCLFFYHSIIILVLYLAHSFIKNASMNHLYFILLLYIIRELAIDMSITAVKLNVWSLVKLAHQSVVTIFILNLM